ncbi:MAG: glycosyltransferase [Actinobacteria bacterium]|nr:glycosyltransferase [Actinomycetota bacterium]
MRLALDVSAVPAQPAGAGRYVVELASRVANPECELTLVSQVGDAERWRRWSPMAHVVDVVPRARPSRLLYEAVALGRSAKISADVWHGPHYTMPRRRTRPTVVTTSDVPYFFFLGTFEPRKGLELLLEAFTVVANDDAEVELWLAGQAGWGTDGVAQQIAEHPFTDRIRRLGYVDDALVPTLMRSSRAVCYPSRGEGFGLPVLEALACGAQVITSADTVMQEVAGTTARLVPVGDVTVLATEMASTARSTAGERMAVARRARLRAEEFSWERTVMAHRALYTALATHS